MKTLRMIAASSSVFVLLGACTSRSTDPGLDDGDDHVAEGAAPLTTCAAAWVSTTSYKNKPSPATVSRGCGPTGTAFANYLGAFSSTGKDPCVTHGPANSANPWLLPTGCGTIPVPTGPGADKTVTNDQFDTVLPPSSLIGPRQAAYTYANFINAALAAKDRQGLLTMCAGADVAKNVRECAAFLANVAHETILGTEIVENGTPACPSYCDTTQTGACAPYSGKSYYGRGPIQLSWNFNYCHFSQAYYGDDGHTLIQNPDLLATNAAVSWSSAAWYWMTQEGPNTGTNMPYSAHECMQNDLGFGCTIRAINGAIECTSLGGGHGTAGVYRQKRITYYHSVLSVLGGVAVGSDDC